MNPWKVIGGIVPLGVLPAVVMFQCGNVLDPPKVLDPAKQFVTTDWLQQHPVNNLKVESTCLDNDGRKIANVHLTNTSNATIPSATVMVIARFKDTGGNEVSIASNYLSPQNILPGGTKSTKLYYDGGDAKSCEVVIVQYGDGEAVVIQ